MNHFPLDRAYLCPDCSRVSSDANQCPACANRCGLMNLAAVLDRDPVMVEACAIFGTLSEVMREAPFAA